MRKLTVAQDGSGDFTCLQAALDSIRVHPLEPIKIFVKSGVYYEKISIPDNKPNIHIIGENKEETIISFNHYAYMKDQTNTELGTFRTSVLSVHADDFIMENITIENTAGYGDEIGQALALYVSGDRCIFKNIRLLGYQDTLYSSRGRQYYYNCYIAGHVDFIFGSGVCVFDHCTIHSLLKGYITAASTPEHQPFGFVFINCIITGSAESESVYLGRPWRPHAHTAFIHCWLGEHIKPVGWNNWRDQENEKTARYVEFKNSGPAADPTTRANWSRQLNMDEANKFTLQNIFRSPNEWIPEV